MGLPSPKNRKPRASEVVEWALTIAKNKTSINVDGRFGAQCWDLPNYLLKRYWGFFTWGNANAMAQKSNYRGYKFQIIRNTKNFVPKPGDFAVWTGGAWGHVAIVVGPSNKSYFTSVDQNWYTNNTYGSPPYKIRHTYHDGPGGATHFVRPPYAPEPKQPQPKPEPNTSGTTTKPSVAVPKPKDQPETIKVWKDVKKIAYTISSQETKYPENINHYITFGNVRSDKPKGLIVRNAQTMCGVEELYNTRQKYIRDSEYPHFYIDRNHMWSPRKIKYEVPSDPNYIVIEICEDYSASENEFILNEIHAMIVGIQNMNSLGIPIKRENIKVDKQIWRSMIEHVKWDMVVSGKPPTSKYEDLERVILNLYANREKIINEIPKETVSKSRIKVEVKNKNANNTKANDSTTKTNTVPKPGTLKTRTETSKYTFAQALRAQMSKGVPQISNGWSWYRPTETQVKNAMNPTTIWNGKVQRYQMLDLGKYQGVSIDNLNKLLKGKGTLSGQGKAFADACKKYNVNEIYLIAHALLESANGTSNFASGRYGIYNFFGINAHDNNPNLAINYAKRQGWTTPAKGIAGGAKFVRNDFFNKGKDTLYRMRWNPKNPGTMQYATDIRWASHQATTIGSYYKKIGLTGIYFIRDKYRG